MQDKKAELRELCRQSRFPEALKLADALCSKIPQDPELWFMTGAVHGALGAFDKAEDCCRKALLYAPDQALLHYNLGIALSRQGRAAEAEVALSHANSLQPRNAMILTALADSLLQLSQAERAVGVYREALAIKPDQPDALRNLAIAHQRLKQFEAADTWFGKAAAADAAASGTYLQWSRMWIQHGALAQALTIVEQALHRLPRDADLHYQRGYLLSESARQEEALRCFDICISIKPDHTEARLARASILRHTGRLSEAESDIRQVLESDDADARAHAGLSALLRDEGDVDGMLMHARRAVELEPENPDMHQHMLMDLHYAVHISPEDLLAAHRDWADRFGHVPDVRAQHCNVVDPERLLRIAYISADFRQHSVAHFIEPVLAQHDRNRVLVYCYSNLRQERHDPVTARLRSLADLWRDVATLNDAELAALIAADGIDVLVDLSGHTSGNRLGVFARHPAPVQISWLGYPNTTGMAAVDYRLTDSSTDPPEVADRFAVECLRRLPEGFLCYAPPADAPDCGGPACSRNGFVTFGSLNNLAKINSDVIALWSAIINATPGSHLLLKGAAFADAAVRERVLRRFADHGVTADRLDLLVYTRSVAEHFACYHRIDIALDTFPYNGTTTTCEALWMGVPVVCLVGSTHASRVGLSILRQMDLSEYACTTVEDYRARVIALADDRLTLEMLHDSLRERMRGSTLMDAHRFCRQLENEYRTVWRIWCSKTDQLR